MDCLQGYRIAIDLDLETMESKGTLVACLKDGIVRQFNRMYCDNPPSGIKEIPGLNPKDDVRSFTKNLSKVNNVMYVGHLPFMEKLVSLLVTGDENKKVIAFQNAGIIKLQYLEEEKHWVIAGALLPRAV